jgi:hypothetical protein
MLGRMLEAVARESSRPCREFVSTDPGDRSTLDLF